MSSMWSHKANRNTCAEEPTRSWRGKKRMCFVLLALTVSIFSGCRMDMQDQPKYKAYRKSDFFKDGTSSRAIVAGTIPRGYLREDKLLYTGRMDAGGAPIANAPAQQAPATTPGQPPEFEANLATAFPFPINEEVVRRGQSRYQIFCSVCHGATGFGDGMIVRRGFKQPPSFHTDRMRQAPLGHFFDVMTRGFGVMPSYSSQINPIDRWAIISYIRALQLSQNPQPQQPAAPNSQQPTRTTTGTEGVR